ncbi:MAG: YcjX family protein [Aeromonas sp.]
MRTQWTRLQDKASETLNRARDRHLRLAVTGLSRSGKTAFITALVNQLEYAGRGARLPLWQAHSEGRILGVRRVVQQNPHIPTFAYAAAKAALLGTPPAWPSPTRGVAEVRLEIRYRTQSLLKKPFGDIATLYVDLVDYPGEWLLDLPLLNQTYAQWSQQVQAQLAQATPRQRELAQTWCAQRWQAADAFDENAVRAASDHYSQYLHRCKDDLGLHLIQPGRFVLPGEYAGAPMLAFVPWLWDAPASALPDTSLYTTLAARFEHYKRHLVQGFYREHFAHFDRQIVLIDCLQPLNRGAASFYDLKAAIDQLMQSFHYGQSAWWRRLLAPRIDKLLMVASKADHVTPEQQGPLVSLLRQLVEQAQASAQFAGIEHQCMALAAINATEVGQATREGQVFAALSGTDMHGAPLRVFPGDVPAHIPSTEAWPAHGFAFPAFRPALMAPNAAMPHIRLDAALEFLLGDHLH